MRWISYVYDRMDFTPHYDWIGRVPILLSKFRCVNVVNPRPPFRRCN